ncbi:hypothetical protein HHL16_08630 [Pseudoflavitalea sp. G-6-1-2]|uniref:hypothetical protein n=1 Tax=Pseudoflavitalea sp. G-6-1-2 TaxID=2728841 RepID=UPI00146A74D9|nr:hypothetical protein [Pseudoflavitalea sp. G-6-1-2]NML20937.1 hypothetical protein [Pseudoflavitalea sp. G-6-1-2]
MMQTLRNNYCFVLIILILTGCTKVDYTKIEEPAYLRIFNDFNYGFSMDDKDKKAPFLCMLVDPAFDAEGKPAGAKIIGDFLDVRDPYAPPYPSHVGSSTSVYNPEYPGKEDVLVGPLVNGYDLSSWAQFPAGQHRFMFMYRPKNSVGFFQLDKSLQNDVMLDTVITLNKQEVYTMHLLLKDYIKGTRGVLMRKENFHKQPFSDSLNYVNFYNYSSDGFQTAPKNSKPQNRRMGLFQQGIKDKMDIFLTLYPDQEFALKDQSYWRAGLPGYKGKYLATLDRNVMSDGTAPYYNFPLFANPTDDGIVTKSWQCFEFFMPGLTPVNNPYGRLDTDTESNWAVLNCLSNGLQNPLRSQGAFQPNLMVNLHSGKYNPRTFATVSTVEVINGSVYLTTIQRKYPAPQY